jgi:hypothetical protein
MNHWHPKTYRRIDEDIPLKVKFMEESTAVSSAILEAPDVTNVGQNM